MTAQQKRFRRTVHNELSLSKEALKAFQHFKAQTGLADGFGLGLLQEGKNCRARAFGCCGLLALVAGGLGAGGGRGGVVSSLVASGGSLLF
jgi:hypothetical protein